jgi:hypothetical protein
MRSIKENKIFFLLGLFFLSFGCKEGNKFGAFELNQSSGISSRRFGNWQFSFKRIDELKLDSTGITFRFQIENLEKAVYPILLKSTNIVDFDSQCRTFFESIEKDFWIENNGKVQTAEVCIDRNPDKSKPIIDLLLVFNSSGPYEEAFLVFDDDFFDCGKIMFPL